MNVPAISVVVPLYNKATYISRTLGSILAQSCPNFEVIVVDDGSTDGSSTIVASLADSRIVLVRQANRGRSGARNRGIEVARSELVAFLDADDEMGPGHIRALLRLRRQFPAAGLYATGYRRTFRGNFSVEVTIQPGGDPAPVLISDYFAYAPRGIICSSNVAIPRRILREIGGFPIGETWGEDLDLWTRVALRYPTAYDPAVHNTYHCEAAGRTPPCPPDKEFPAIRSAREALQAGRVPGSLAKSVQEYICLQELELCRAAINAGARQAAWKRLGADLKNSRYRRTAQLLEILLAIFPTSIARTVVRVLGSRWGFRVARLGLSFPGINGH